MYFKFLKIPFIIILGNILSAEKCNSAINSILLGILLNSVLYVFYSVFSEIAAELFCVLYQ